MAFTIPNSADAGLLFPARASGAVRNVSYPHSRRLRYPTPKLQVVRAVVRLLTVFVVNLFTGKEGPPKHLLHYHSVFKAPHAFSSWSALNPDVALTIKKCRTNRTVPPNSFVTSRSLSPNATALGSPLLPSFFRQGPSCDGTCMRAVFTSKRRFFHHATALWAWAIRLSCLVRGPRFTSSIERSARCGATSLSSIVWPEHLVALGALKVWEGTRATRSPIRMRFGSL